MAASQLHIALAGNPNCGKTTLFNQITGQNGYVGNWPGVTVEKKEAKLSADKSVTITDLPGIYSLSPYSPEERVSRDYLMSGEPDVVIQVVDATNLERNLYLALQVIETGVPVVVALNMADLVEKNGDKIDTEALSKSLGCPVVMISALKNRGLDNLIAEAKQAAGSASGKMSHKFDSAIEDVLDHIEGQLPGSVPAHKRRYYAVKLFERDADATKLVNLTKGASDRVEELIAKCEQDCDDDAESIITGERYAVIAHIIDGCLKKAPARMSTSEKIDRIVTNRILGLPIFLLIMYVVYYLAISTFGTAGTDWVNDNLFGEGFELFGQSFPSVPMVAEGWLTSLGASDLVISLVNDGIVAGVGAVLGFIPQMFVLFVMLCFLEDCGYMSRVAFVMDRVFRRFGLSGKSFIPMLISSGCGVPGVMATKTIENEKDRRMTAMLTTMIPCGAKTPIIALVMGVLIGGSDAWWVAPMFYFLGLAAIIVSALMLKKTRMFAGDPAPFVMELPDYHFPTLKSWWLHVWERISAYLKKATTIIFAASVVVWFLLEFGFANWAGGNGAFGFLSLMDGAPEYYTDYSLLAIVGNAIAWIFAPLGADSWQAAAASINALIAKENLVSTFGVIYGIGDATENSVTMWSGFAGMFTDASGILHVGAMCAFVAFNMLDAPCFAAIGTIRRQMDSPKWFWFAIGYQCVFAWVVGLIINQLWELFALGNFGVWTVVAFVLLAAMVFQIARPMPKDESADEKILSSLSESAA